MIFRDLKLAGIGKKPFILIAYSMGGVVTRQIILNQILSSA
jgi:triacylglycerol esterase/lipase EstA (alpha/beta hydrolase family)